MLFVPVPEPDFVLLFVLLFAAADLVPAFVFVFAEAVFFLAEDFAGEAVFFFVEAAKLICLLVCLKS